jgi:nicotinate phosphoribosyltransferase
MALDRTEDVRNISITPGRRFFSATHEEILQAHTTDIYFLRTRNILAHLGRLDTPVAADIFNRAGGVLCGVEEVGNLLRDQDVEIYSLAEGECFEPGEVVMSIRGPYGAFGLYETTLLGMLASSSAWATAAARCKQAAGHKPLLCFGARHVHPAVAPVMERAAIIGGADGCSCILGAVLAGTTPTGTVPHAAIIITGDTLELAQAFDRVVEPDVTRLILVDTFKDEAEETLRVARALKQRLHGVRLDTPSERGGVTFDLVREVRCRLDLEGFEHVKIAVSGGVNPERIPGLIQAGADMFGVGSYISDAKPLDMTMDIKEVDGKPIAKRGRLPGCAKNPRHKKIK